MLLFTEDGGLSAAGYVVFILAAAAVILAAGMIAGRFSERKKASARQLAFCAMGIALGFVTSYIPLIKMPFGGSCTLLSMLFIVLLGYWYGPQTGILVGFAYGILQFIQSPCYLNFIQMCCDYLLAFAALGLGGFFRNKKNGLIKGYLVSVFVRGLFHTLGAYFFWMEYMPESFPKVLAPVYPIVYNYSYLGVEAVLTVIVLSIPAVRKAVQSIGTLARS